MMDCGLGEMDTNMSFDCGVFAGAFDTMESGGDAEPRDVVISRQAAGYGEACDLWSCGVILYFLLCGRPPFAPPDDEPGRKKRKRNGVDLNELTARVLKGDYALDFGPWPRASAAVLDLVKGLMRVDTRARLTAARALEHAWITRDGVAAEVPAPLGAAALTSLARYARATFFHKRVYNALAETLTMGELDSRGRTRRRALRGAALEVEAIVEACDLEDDHRISYHAFVVASMHRCAYLREDRVDKMFHEFLDGVDAAGTETITAESLQSHGFDAEVVADVFAAAKVSPGRGIHRDDFERLLRLGSILGASLGAQSTQAKSLLGDSTDWAQLLGSPPPLGVAGSMDLASAPARRSRPR
ncbi:serine/threonine kinase [Aureococcus anophagefferens]|nr:serine/threonine kinase [Aureococcus anophagefferens]